MYARLRLRCSMRLILTALLVALPCVTVTAPSGAAQEAPRHRDPTPKQLWQSYPLEPRTTPTSPRPHVQRASPSVSVSGGRADRGGGSGSGQPLGLEPERLAVGGAVVAGLLALVLAGVRLRRRRAAIGRRRPAPGGSTPGGRSPGGAQPEAARASGRRKAQPAATYAQPDATRAPSVQPAADAAPLAAEVAVPAARGPDPRSQHAERALGYTTVGSSDEADAEDGREEARRIEEACARHGVALGKLVRDVESPSAPDLQRPGLLYALERLAEREYTCLVVTRLDRLAGSAANLGALIRMLGERGARLIVIDIDLDTQTLEGRLAAEALETVGGLERRKLEQRTRNGLEAARDGRRAAGRSAVSDRPSLERRISALRASGMTLQAIADTLNAEGVPTVRGGAQWRPSSVQTAAGYKRPNRRAGPRSGDSRVGRPDS